MERAAYQYSVVRLVPDVVRDEARNVGVLVQPVSGGVLKFKFLDRARSVDSPDFSKAFGVAEHFREQLSACSVSGLEIGRVSSPLDSTFLSKAVAEFNGTLQVTPPRGMLAVSIEEAVNKSFATFVRRPNEAAIALATKEDQPLVTSPSVLRRRLWSAFSRTRLLRKGFVKRKYTVSGSHAKWTFDIGYERDELSLVNVVALTSPDANTNLGRCLVFKGMLEEVRASHNDVHGIAVLAEGIALSTGDRRHARAILRDAEVEVLPISKVDALVERVQRDFEPELAGIGAS